MAADILLYKATHVPVGDDQKQHLELTRDIAQKFNRDYECDGFFPIPEPIIDKNISRIMSLKNGEQKMSKSDPSDYSRISLTDSADQIEKKIKKAKTADTPMPDNNEDVSKLLEVNNLLNIFSGFSEIDKSELIEKYKGQNFSNFKNNLAEVIIEHIKPISKEIDKLMSDKTYLNQIILSGAEQASEKANVTIKEVYDIVGFVRNET